MLMRRDFFIYCFLLVIGLGSAYYISLPEDGGHDEGDGHGHSHAHNSGASKDGQEWVRIEPSSVTELKFESNEDSVSALRQASGFWVSSIDKKKADDPKSSSPKVDEFKASSKFQELLTGFDPLKVERDIGVLQPEQLEEFGLKEPQGTFVVKAGDKTVLELKIGKKSYGSRNIFALDVKQNKVILLSDESIRGLQKSKSRFMERSLFILPYDDVSESGILAAGKNKVLSHKKRDGSGQLEWSDASGKPKASYKTWMEKLQKLQVVSYATPDEESQLKQVQAFLTVSLKGKSKEDISLEFKKVPGAKGAQDYWVLSSFLGHYAKIPAAKMDPIEKDLPTIVGE